MAAVAVHVAVEADKSGMMCARVLLAAVLGLGLLAAVLPVADAQQVPKVWRIGLLGPPPVDVGSQRLWGALIEGLRERGYVEGHNIVFERREVADDLVRLKVDLIVAPATQFVHAAKRASNVIPIVMPNHGDPVGAGVVASLARPGGNVTGLSILNPELTGKRLELLKQAVPRLLRVGVLSNPASQTHHRMLSETEAGARQLGLHLHKVQARGVEDYESAFASFKNDHAEALVVLGDVTFWLHRNQIAALAGEARLPTIFAQREHVEVGGLMAYGADLRDNYRRAAVYVDKILKGAKPADLPIEQPTKFELVINLKTAKALGLTIPPSLLLRADQVIE